MAVRIECGPAERNERGALEHLTRALGPDWCLLTSIPRHVTGEGVRGREIDALALSPRGAVVIELKHIAGDIEVTPVGEWLVGGQTVTDARGRTVYPLQQAGKAAQALKSALGGRAGGTYIDACAVATGEAARVAFSDPGRPTAVAALADAAALVEYVAARGRGVQRPALEAIFDLVGKPVPAELDRRWRAAEQQRAAPARGRPPSRSTAEPAQGRSSGWFWLALVLMPLLVGLGVFFLASR